MGFLNWGGRSCQKIISTEHNFCVTWPSTSAQMLTIVIAYGLIAVCEIPNNIRGAGSHLPIVAQY